MSPCSSSWVSPGALPRACDKVSSTAVSVPSSGMKERLQGRRLAMDDRMRLHRRSTITTRAHTPAPVLSSSYTMAAITRPLVSKGPLGKTAHRKQHTARKQHAALPVHPWSRPRLFAAIRFPLSNGLQVLGRRLPGLTVVDDFEGDLLAFLELVEPSALDRADVDEDVLAAILRLDKSVALLGVEPLHGAFAHFWSFIYVSFESHARAWLRLVSRFWEVISQARQSRQGQVVRPKLDGEAYSGRKSIVQGRNLRLSPIICGPKGICGAKGHLVDLNLRTVPNGQGTVPMNARCFEIGPLWERQGGRLWLPWLHRWNTSRSAPRAPLPLAIHRS